MSIECSILNISAPGLHAQSISFSKQILQCISVHQLSLLFKIRLEKFFPLVTNWKELTYNKRKWHSKMNPQSVKCLTHSQQLPHVSCGAGALIKACFAPVLVVKGRLHKALGSISARQLCYMCMPMRPNKAETAVHGCHYLGQEPIRLLPGWYDCAYARPWVGVWALVSPTFIFGKELPLL